MSTRRVAVLAGAEDAAVHGLDGRFGWGEGRSFDPADADGLRAWAPGTVIALGARAPDGPWRTIAWAAGDRRATLPAADSLASLRARLGTGVLVVGSEEAARESALVKLGARRVEASGAERLTRAGLEGAAVVALLGAPDAPMPDGAAAVLAAGRILVAPRADPAFGMLPWSDHLPYENEDELACSADVAQSFPEAFESIVAMGILAAEAHLASAVYGRLAVYAELADDAGRRLDASASS